MKKHALLIAALAAALCLSACGGSGGGNSPANAGGAGGTVASSTQTGTSGLTYEPQIGGYVVSGYSGISADVTIPDSYADGPVVKVGKHAFQQLDVASVTLGANVREIEKYAFRMCKRLTRATLNEGLETLDGFTDATALQEIAIPSTVTTIRTTAFFRDYALASVTFAPGSRLERIESGAFRDCASLKSINLEDTSLVSLDSSVFENCAGIRELRLPASCVGLGTGVFSGWTADQTIYLGCRPEDIRLCYGGNLTGPDDYDEAEWNRLYGLIFEGCEAKIVFP